MASQYSLRLYHDKMEANAKAEVIYCQHTAVYCLAGSAVVNGHQLNEDEAVYCQDSVDICAGSNGATVWRWELERTVAPYNVAVVEGVFSAMKMARVVDMFNMVPTSKWLFRLDAIVDFEGCTGIHSHPGSGIRSLRKGHMIVESNIGESSDNHGCGAVWYEEGAYPLVSTVIDNEACTFLRGMVMPQEYNLIQNDQSPNWITSGGDQPCKGDWKGYFQKVVTLR